MLGIRDRYLDTPSLALHRRGLAYRVRTTGEGPPRAELVCRGEVLLAQKLRGHCGAERLPRGPLAERIAREIGGPAGSLEPLVQLDTRTRRYRLEAAAAGDIEVRLDRFRVTDGAARPLGDFAEIELSSTTANDETLWAIIASLLEARPPAIPLLSALERALWMTGKLPVPMTPEPPQAPPRLPGAVLTGRLRRHLERMQAYAPLAAEGIDPEGVHQMRTEIRRLRTALRAARPWVGAHLDFWSGELGHLARVLGEVRDADVLLMDFRRLRKHAAAHDLFRLLEHDRAIAREHLLAALDSERQRALVAGLGDYLAQAAPHWPAVTEFARQTLPKRRRKLVRIGSRITNRSPDEALHRARIEAKKLRYLLELCLPEDPSATLREALQATRRLQSLLGRHQDACVARERLAELGTRIGNPKLLRPFVEQATRRRRKTRARFGKQWAAFERSVSKAALAEVYRRPGAHSG